jgi:hypothetical protein
MSVLLHPRDFGLRRQWPGSATSGRRPVLSGRRTTTTTASRECSAVGLNCRVSYDLYFWPSGAVKHPRRVAERLADEDAGGLAADQRVLAFRAELLRRWPDLADRIAPWHHDLGWWQPWGHTDLADRFVGLTLPHGWADTDALPALAGGFGLDSYDPQSDRLMPPRARPSDAVAQVAGWVDEDHVVTLMRQISAYIGYAYDELDEVALTGALDDTDDEKDDGWFEYPLAGTPPLSIRLARSPGSAVVSVRVDGPADPVLAARVETLLDLL